MISRRKGRELGMQILYGMEVGGQPFDAAFSGLTVDSDIPVTPDTFDYGKKLARKALEHRDAIEQRIADAAQNYGADRIAVIDRLVLVCAVTELLYFPDVPIKVCINEAIDIAKKFSTEQSSRFVNGILDTISRQISNLPARKDEHAP